MEETGLDTFQSNINMISINGYFYFQNVHSCLLICSHTKPRRIEQKELYRHILECYGLVNG